MTKQEISFSDTDRKDATAHHLVSLSLDDWLVLAYSHRPLYWLTTHTWVSVVVCKCGRNSHIAAQMENRHKSIPSPVLLGWWLGGSGGI